ncbi:MAG: hypothetical protein JNL70_16935 [Saprospiraceae bacterium]|nr:hypothetical protein [Saprospiraceae bacterium]
MNQTFPYFESGLPLRSRDLNAIYRRAEEEVRETRTCLQGMGIFYGLTVTPIATGGFTIGKGAGVTSQGYLLCLHSDLQLTHYVVNNQFDANQFSIRLFSEYLDNIGIKPVANVTVWELIEKTSQSAAQTGTPLPNDLNNKVLVALFSINSVKSQGCATCEKGTSANMNVKYLLIDDTPPSDNTQLSNWGKVSANFTPVVSGTIEGRADLKAKLLSLPRLTGFSSISTERELTTGYTTAINSNLTAIKSDLNASLTVCDTLFQNGTEGVSALTALDNLGISDDKAQYIHDYWRLIIRAYNELVSTPIYQNAMGLPPENSFPKHLVLNNWIKTERTETSASVMARARTPFYRPPFDGVLDKDFERTKRLYLNLVSILKNHIFGGDLPREALKITPSRRPSYPLSMQAIPFYLNANAKEHWRADLMFSERIPFYGDNATSVKALIVQPYFDEADFYRIEGHIGLTKAPIEGERDKQNLPFRVIEVTLSQQTGKQTLADFASKNSGLEHQGGVPTGGTFVVVTVDKLVQNQRQSLIVADFCLPYWVPDEIVIPQPPVPIVADFTTNQKDNLFIFRSISSANAINLNWFVNDRPATNTELSADKKTFTPNLTLTEGETSKHFFIKLEAVAADQRRDVEIATVVITRAVQAPVVEAGLAEESRDNGKTNEDKTFTQAVTFSNKTQGNADFFHWQPFESDGITEAGMHSRRETVDEEYLQHFTLGVDVREKIFRMQVTAFVKEKAVDTAQIDVIIRRGQGILPEIDSEGNPIVSERGLLTAEIPPSVIEPPDALKNLRTRHRNYRTALEQAAVGEKNSTMDDKIYAALNFIAAFQDSNIEQEAIRWERAVKAALPAKTDKQLSASQLAMVQNLVYFFLDKVSHLQTDGISTPIIQILTKVFEKIKSYKSSNINELKEKWQTGAIRTNDNTAVVDSLLNLF